MKRVTALKAILADIDERIDSTGKKKIFSIGFFLKDGSYVFFPKAIKTGLRYSVKKTDSFGIQEVDCYGNNIGHVYPVWIHAISLYKSKYFSHEY